MIQTIQNWLTAVSEAVGQRPFFFGFLAGLAALLAVLLILVLLGLLLAPRKLKFLVISSDGGEIRIDAKAVQDSVLAVASHFPAFEVRKVCVYGKQTSAELLIQLDYQGGEPISTLAARFRSAIALMMTDTFGMEKPANIELEIVRSCADAPAVKSEIADGAESEKAGTTDAGTTC